MGTEGPKAVTVNVTGFRKFQGVSENPTETIVSNLKNFIETRGLHGGITLGSCTILDTAGEDALPVLNKLLQESTQQIDAASSNRQIVWLHLGVNSGAQKFAIERRALNEATFRCPDEFGWQPDRVPIVPEDGGISHTRETSCAVDAIVKMLKSKGFEVMLSEDAGRFVCNYVYYHSLGFAEKNGLKSLFVHFPLFSCIDEETQMQFVASLLDAIAFFTL